MPTIPDPYVHARYYRGKLPAMALFVDEPWWWPVLSLGDDIINVHFDFQHRGPLAIVSRGQTPWHRRRDVEAIAALLKADGRPSFDAYACPQVNQRVVGIVNVVDCHGDTQADSRWFVGPFALKVDQQCMLPFSHAPTMPHRAGGGLAPLSPEKQGSIRYALAALANGAVPGAERRR